MNSVVISGNLVKEINFSMTGTGMALAKFSLAVKRKVKDKATGRYESDFISFVAWGKTAETLANYVHNGDQVIIRGHIQTGSYTDKNGVKKYTTDVIVDEMDFGAKSAKNQAKSPMESMGGTIGEEEIMF